MILRFEIRTSSLRTLYPQLGGFGIFHQMYRYLFRYLFHNICIIGSSPVRWLFVLTPGVPYVLSTSNNYARFEVGRAVRVGVASSLHACKPIRLGIDGIVPSCDGASHVKTGEARREAV